MRKHEIEISSKFFIEVWKLSAPAPYMISVVVEWNFLSIKRMSQRLSIQRAPVQSDDLRGACHLFDFQMQMLLVEFRKQFHRPFWIDG